MFVYMYIASSQGHSHVFNVALVRIEKDRGAWGRGYMYMFRHLINKKFYFYINFLF